MVIATIAAVTIVLFVRTASAVLTSANNTITLEPGYYDSVTVSTDITSLSGTITYTHHQCSTESSSETYEDNTASMSNAAVVSSQTTVNGTTVSTVEGGCFTKPYYKYTVYHPGTSYSYQEACNGYYIQRGYASGNDGSSYPHYYCSACSYSQVGGTWHGHSKTVTKTTPAYTTTEYGETLPSNGTLVTTYYLKSCGYDNGALLSVTITY